MDRQQAPEHASWYLAQQQQSSKIRLDVRLGRGLDMELTARERIESVYWENMEDVVKPTSLYSESKEKHLELFDPEQYYLSLHSSSQPSELLAYVALRVCKEDTQQSLDTGDESKQVDVLYIYELQTVKGHQGKGLGAALVDDTMKMAERLHLSKVMLTCLKHNVPALRFYKKHGFKPDEIDPTYSYRLSLFTRLLQRQRHTKGGGAKDKSALLKAVDKDWAEGDVERREDADYRILSRKVARGDASTTTK